MGCHIHINSTCISISNLFLLRVGEGKLVSKVVGGGTLLLHKTSLALEFREFSARDFPLYLLVHPSIHTFLPFPPFLSFSLSITSHSSDSSSSDTSQDSSRKITTLSFSLLPPSLYILSSCTRRNDQVSQCVTVFSESHNMWILILSRFTNF